MPKKQQRRDAIRNRDRILAAARRTFAEDGTDATIAAVARTAGVGTATLYRHFPTRDDLIAATYGEQFRHCLAVLDDALSDPLPWNGFLRALETVVRIELDSPGISQIMMGQATVPHFHTFQRNASQGLRDLATRLRVHGVVRDDFSGADIFLILQALRAVTIADREHALPQTRRLTEHLVEGIRSQPADRPHSATSGENTVSTISTITSSGTR